MISLPKNLSVDKSGLFQLASELPLSRKVVESTLESIGGLPDREDWHGWLTVILYGLGTALFLAGVIFFFAYNWEQLERFERFALLGLGVVISATAAYWLGLEKLSGKLWLTTASIITGVLLATFGMVYQTGADSYVLFYSWAALIAPWVIAARFQPLWLIWLVLVNMAVLRWAYIVKPSFLDPENFLHQLMLLGFVINAVMLLVRETTSLIHLDPATGRWLPRIIAASLLAGLTAIPVEGIIDDDQGFAWSILLGLYFITLVSIGYFYVNKRHDLVMLTLAMISIMVVLTVGVIHTLFENSFDDGMFFITGIIIILETAAAAAILMHFYKKWKVEEEYNELS